MSLRRVSERARGSHQMSLRWAQFRLRKNAAPVEEGCFAGAQEGDDTTPWASHAAFGKAGLADEEGCLFSGRELL